MKRVTIRAVANEAGVSTSTVSNVLNGRHEQMAAGTLLRVQTAMGKLGYRPSQLAKSLVTNRTATIGLVVRELIYPVNPAVVVGAEAACRDAGYSLLLANASDLETEQHALQTMCSKQVDGLILYSLSSVGIDHDQLYRIQQEGTPVIVINRYLPQDAPLARVYFDHVGGAMTMTRHLIDLGHVRIAHIAGPPRFFSGRQRRYGYEAGLAEAGIAVDERLVVEGDYSFESGRHLMHELWRERPTAVFVSGDVMALGALRATAELGLRVPDDLSLTGFGNPDCIRYATPLLTTMDLPVAEAGSVATGLVLEQLHRRNGQSAEPAIRTLETHLLVNQTTAPPPTGVDGRRSHA
jgi:LacI family transcriptional regulator